jgi:PAS domain-containing protein
MGMDRGGEEVGMDQNLVDFEGSVAALSDFIVGVRHGRHEVPADALFAELETANEELRVATEELQTQQDEVEALTATLTSRQWRHERLLALLPEAVVSTDVAGSIRSANAAAANLLGVGVDWLLRRSIQGLVVAEDRPEVRSALSGGVLGGETFRCSARMQAGGHEAVAVELVGTVHDDGAARRPEVLWLLRRQQSPRRHPGPGDARALARALAELTGLPLLSQERHTVIAKAAHICQTALGNGVEVSIAIGRPCHPVAVATTSALAQRIDGAQIQADEGPCDTAFETRHTVISADLSADHRWPKLAQALEGLSPTGAVALPLEHHGQIVGSLNVYGAPKPEMSIIGGLDLLASAIGAILAEFAIRHELASTAEHLRFALTSRSTIDQAKGVIMAQRRCSADDAFAVLKAMSQDSNIKLRDVAADLVQRTQSGVERPN